MTHLHMMENICQIILNLSTIIEVTAWTKSAVQKHADTQNCNCDIYVLLKQAGLTKNFWVVKRNQSFTKNSKSQKGHNSCKNELRVFSLVCSEHIFQVSSIYVQLWQRYDKVSQFLHQGYGNTSGYLGKQLSKKAFAVIYCFKYFSNIVVARAPIHAYQHSGIILSKPLAAFEHDHC